METFRNQRFRVLMDTLKNQGVIYNDADFCRKMGVNRAQVSECASGKRAISERFALRVANTFPKVNYRYLLDENCSDMFVNESFNECSFNVNNGHDQKVGADAVALQKIIEKQQAQIDRLLGIIEKLQQG